MHRSIVASIAVWLGMSSCAIQTVAENPRRSTASVLAMCEVGSNVSDIKLDNATLHGRVLDRDGTPMHGSRVVLANRAGATAVTTTDRLGRFRFTGVKSGTWILDAGLESRMVRAWKSKVAPPSARPEVMLVAGPDLVRGQCAQPNCLGCDQCSRTYDGHFAYRGHFGGIFQQMLQNPWVTGLGTAAGIAIPLVANDDDQGANTVRSTVIVGDPDAS